MLLADIHARLANTAILYFLIVSIWGWVRYFRKQDIDSTYWGMLAIAEILVLAQALLGGYLWIAGLRPGRTLHLLYGTIVLLMIPGAYIYTRGRDERPEVMIYSMVTIVAVGLIMRAMVTGAHTL
jgi:heme A synthase